MEHHFSRDKFRPRSDRNDHWKYFEFIYWENRLSHEMQCSIDLHRTAERSFMERSFRCRMQNQPVCRPLGSIGRMEIEGRRNWGVGHSCNDVHTSSKRPGESCPYLAHWTKVHPANSPIDAKMECPK